MYHKVYTYIYAYRTLRYHVRVHVYTYIHTMMCIPYPAFPGCPFGISDSEFKVENAGSAQDPEVSLALEP